MQKNGAETVLGYGTLHPYEADKLEKEVRVFVYALSAFMLRRSCLSSPAALPCQSVSTRGVVWRGAFGNRCLLGALGFSCLRLL